jgi:hypothetical protein
MFSDVSSASAPNEGLLESPSFSFQVQLLVMPSSPFLTLSRRLFGEQPLPAGSPSPLRKRSVMSCLPAASAHISARTLGKASPYFDLPQKHEEKANVNQGLRGL